MEGNLAWKGTPLELNINAIFPLSVYDVDLNQNEREVGSKRDPLFSPKWKWKPCSLSMFIIQF